jgi:hypothetical protein
MAETTIFRLKAATAARRSSGAPAQARTNWSAGVSEKDSN